MPSKIHLSRYTIGCLNKDNNTRIQYICFKTCHLTRELDVSVQALNLYVTVAYEPGLCLLAIFQVYCLLSGQASDTWKDVPQIQITISNLHMSYTCPHIFLTPLPKKSTEQIHCLNNSVLLSYCNTLTLHFLYRNLQYRYTCLQYI